MKVLIFGGTAEGRELSAALSGAGICVTLSVATEYGRSMAAGDGVEVLTGMLGEAEMIALMKQGPFDCVIDATHPYAVIAAQNIISACRVSGIKYYRLKRPVSGIVSGVTYVPDMITAAKMLNKNNEKALLTVGSKELESFTCVENYRKRLYIRILPSEDSLKKALNLGFSGPNIICMHGPFDIDINTSILKMTGAKYLVTKDSGDAGGFGAKVSAAFSLGCEVIAIERPVQEEGLTLNELLKVFNVNERHETLARAGKDLDDLVIPRLTRNPIIVGIAGQARNDALLRKTICTDRTFFPFFIDIKDKKLLITGGGNVAERRVKILSAFGADITVIAPKASEYIKFEASQGRIRLMEREYRSGDISELGAFVVIAATDDRQANRNIMIEAVNLNIPISVADSRGECTFRFPAIAESDSYVAGIISKNGDHTGVKRMAEKIRGLLGS